MGRGKGEVVGSRSVLRRSMIRFAALSMFALLLLGVGTVIVSRDIAQDEAGRDAQNRAMVLANGVAAPLVNRAVRAGTPAAMATLSLVLRNRIAEGSIEHIKLWASDGTVIWADNGAIVGMRFQQPAEIRALSGTRNATSELSDLQDAENVGEADEAPLLEVY